MTVRAPGLDEAAQLAPDGAPATRRATDRWVALLVAFLVGADVPLAMRMTTATIAAVVLLPVWVGVLSRYRNAVALILLACAALLAGVLMSTYGPDTRIVDVAEARGTAVLLLTSIGSLGVLLWARSVVGVLSMVLAYGLGALIFALPSAAGSPNPWKYFLAIPVSLVVLAVVGRTRSVTLWVVALGGLGAAGILMDHRSYFGVCLLTSLVLVWHARSHGLSRRGARLRALVFGAVGAYALYLLATTAMVAGYLGSENQERSLNQVQAGGGLLLGGRPEWAASAELMTHFPFGFGLGAVPTLQEVIVAKGGLASVGISGSNGYVEHYMFGGRFELHSVIADLWAWFGLLGLALGLLIGVVLVWGLTRPAEEVAVRPVVTFMCVVALWFVAFGPFYTSAGDIVLALAMSLPLVGSGQGIARAADPVDLHHRSGVV